MGSFWTYSWMILHSNLKHSYWGTEDQKDFPMPWSHNQVIVPVQYYSLIYDKI